MDAADPAHSSGFVEWLAVVCHDPEMARLMREFRWVDTPLGHPDTWPVGLRTAVGVCMATRFPMVVLWGPELVKVYNDGYRDMLGAKHPAALGAPAKEVWPEIWETIGPLLEGVRNTATPTWEQNQRLLLDRNGFVEECYFTYSYSPLFDDDGTVGGVLDVARETTEQVVAERRLEALADLTSQLVTATQVTEVCRQAVAVLRRWPDDVSVAEVYLRVGDDDEPALVATSRRVLDELVPRDLVATVATERRSLTVGDHGEGTRPARHHVMAVQGGYGSVEGVLALTLNPLRPFDAEYRRYVELVGQVVGTALDSAYRRSVEVGDHRRISEALQESMLRPVSNFETVAARYLPAVDALAVGGDWYDVIDLGNGERAIVVGDCVGHGIEAATVMAQMRSASRAMLLDGATPSETLEALDSLAAAVSGARGATAAVAVIDRRRMAVTYSLAGHPPPLAVGAHGHRWLDGARGVPLGLGLGDPQRHDAVEALEPEGLVVFYTDGLVEVPGASIDAGLARLAEHATALRNGRPVQQLADELLAAMLPGGIRDDVVLVAKTLPLHEPDRPSR